MSSLQSRSVVPRTVPPPAALPRVPIAQIGTPCFCDCTGSVVGGVAHGSGSVTSPFVGGSISDTTDINACDAAMSFSLARGIICTADMDASITIDHWWNTNPTGFDERTGMTLTCRSDRGASHSFGYQFFVGGNTYATRTTTGFASLVVYDGSGSTSLGSVGTGINLVDGGALELSCIGSAIVAKFNGSTLFSVTDATIGDTITYGITNLPAQYAHWVGGAAASTMTASGFSVTPTCP